MKITQREIVVRVLAKDMGNWVSAFNLQKVQTEWGWLGVDADTRAHELARDGTYKSPNFTYYIEHRAPRENGNPTKYAQFRCYKKEPHQYVHGLRDFTFASVE